MSERNKKREQFQNPQGGRKKWLLPAALAAIILAGASTWILLVPHGGGHQVIAANSAGFVSFAASDFSDGKAKFYRYQGSSGAIDFFIVKSRDGVIRAAFDSCDVCFRERKGYRQDGQEMVCLNCDQRFPTDKVNVVKGGCNPAPLKRSQQGDRVMIAATDIEQGARYFQDFN